MIVIYKEFDCFFAVGGVKDLASGLLQDGFLDGGLEKIVFCQEDLPTHYQLDLFRIRI